MNQNTALVKRLRHRFNTDCNYVRILISVYKQNPRPSRKRYIKATVFNMACYLTTQIDPEDRRTQKWLLQHILGEYNRALNLESL